jgi:PAS domain S-box-containing protein
MDLVGRVISANPRFCEMVGWDEADLIGRSVLDIVEPADVEKGYASHFWTAMRQGEHRLEEYRYLRPDGRIVWAIGSHTPVRDTAGEVTHILVLARDTTDIEMRAADHRGQIDAIGRSQCVAEFDIDGVILSANDRFLAAFDYELADVVGRHHAMFVGGETRRSAEYAAFWSSLQSGEFRAGEFRRLAKGGREVWIQATYSPILGIDGKPFKVVKYATDVTAAKLVNADFSGQIEAIEKSQLVIEFDLDGRILKANDRFLAAMGYSLDQVVGLHHRMFVPPEEVGQPAYESFWEDLRQGCFQSGEFRRLSREGEEVWLQASYSPIKDLNGRPFKIVKYAMDMTAEIRRKHAEVRLQAEHAASEAATRAKSHFLANMSHELRTPLTSILGFSRLLGEGSALSERDRGHIALIQNAGETLLAVVNDILDFSRLEAGAMNLELQPFSVDNLVSGVCELLKPHAEGKAIELICEAVTGAELVGDASRLRQVLLNLSGNALKFTHAGSVTLRATVEADEAGQSVLSCRVEDTGIGIDPALQTRLFQRFSQADDSISRRYGGSGLGLAISRQLVEAMGGVMGVDSDGVSGSTFWFSIPLASAEARSVEYLPTAVENQGAPLGFRVLIVDDHPANRTLVSSVLTPLGVEVDQAGDGAEGVEAAGANAYDIILMDMQMPVMDGITATRTIRCRPGPNQTTTILALSANILPDQVAQCLAAGMDRHLSKPIDFGALVEALLETAGAREGLAA